MKVISVKQPYAWLMANRFKRLQPITWKSDHRGVLLLHASNSFPESLKRLCKEHPDISGVMRGLKADQLPRACIIAVLYVSDCLPVSEVLRGEMVTHKERAFGNFNGDRHVLVIEAVRQLSQPVRVDGRKGLWDLEDQFITPELTRIAREMGARLW